MGESVDVHINSYTYFDIPCTLISYVDECRYVRGNVDTSSLAGDTAFAYDTSSVNTHEKHDSPRSRNSDTSRKVKSTRALDKNLYVCNKIHLYHNHLVDSIRRTKLKENNLEPFRRDGIWIYCML